VNLTRVPTAAEASRWRLARYYAYLVAASFALGYAIGNRYWIGVPLFALLTASTAGATLTLHAARAVRRRHLG
jgi:hypothetical protein